MVLDGAVQILRLLELVALRVVAVMRLLVWQQMPPHPFGDLLPL